MEALKSFYRTVQLKGNHSPSYLQNNLAKSDTYCALVKNGFLSSRIMIYKL